MSSNFGSRLIERATALDSLSKEICDGLEALEDEKGSRFDATSSIINTNISIASYRSRTILLLGFLDQLKEIDEVEIAPETTITQFFNKLDKIITILRSIASTISNIQSQELPFIIDHSTFLISDANGKELIKLSDEFSPLYEYTENAIADFYTLASIFEIKGFADLSRLFSYYERRLKQLDELLHEHQIQTEILVHTKEALEPTEEEIRELVAEISRQKSLVDQDRKSILEREAEATTKVVAIREIAIEAEKLRSSVQSYKNDFSEFQEKLDSRNRNIKDGNERANQLFNRIAEVDSEITDRLDRAEKMLMASTVAGLAFSFGEIRDKLTKDRERARNHFYGAIALLALSAGVAVFNLLPFSIPIQKANESSLLNEAGTFLLRLMFVIPSIWLVKFTAARHAAFFRLKEQYEYKYSLASSVESFKRQAPEYQDEIAAATYIELAFNPAERIDTKGPEQKHPNVIMDKLLNKLGFNYDGKSSHSDVPK